MVKLTQEEQRQLRRDLIALDCAAALAYERLFGQRHREKFGLTPQESGNALASALAACVSIYTHDEYLTAFTRLEPSELQHAIFRRGGREARFPDGLALGHLAVRLSDLKEAITNPETLPIRFHAESAAETGFAA